MSQYINVLLTVAIICTSFTVSGQVFINREGPVSNSEVFGIRKKVVPSFPFTDPYGGMYVETTNLASARPYYGYAMDSVFKAFHYYDGLSGSWRLFNNGDRLTVREDGNVGIGTTLPAERLQVEGAIKIGNSSSANPTAGTVRWNPDTEDFEGYTGTTWKSLTLTRDTWGRPVTPANVEDQGIESVIGVKDTKISGNYGVVGGFGAADIYENVEGSWALSSDLTASDVLAGEDFGFSVDISGDFAIVGARRHKHSGLLNAGAAYIFVRNGSNWLELQKLTATSPGADDYYGQDVALSGDLAAVCTRGGVYVYERDVATWNEVAFIELTPSNLLIWCVDISASYVCYGVINGLDQSWVGKVYVYEAQGADWIQRAVLQDSSSTPSNSFGTTVAIDGNIIVVGHPDDTGVASESGSAIVYRDTPFGWLETQKITASDAQSDHLFGIDVDISGEYIIVGASKDDYLGISGAGSAYIFEQEGVSWYEKTKLAPSVPQEFGAFGVSVAIDGDDVAVGAPTATSVYFFSR